MSRHSFTQARQASQDHTYNLSSSLALIIIVAPSQDAHFCASPLHQIMPQDKSRQIFIGNIPYG